MLFQMSGLCIHYQHLCLFDFSLFNQINFLLGWTCPLSLDLIYNNLFGYFIPVAYVFIIIIVIIFYHYYCFSFMWPIIIVIIMYYYHNLSFSLLLGLSVLFIVVLINIIINICVYYRYWQRDWQINRQ